jgi:hypothetical protein
MVVRNGSASRSRDRDHPSPPAYEQAAGPPWFGRAFGAVEIEEAGFTSIAISGPNLLRHTVPSPRDRRRQLVAEQERR